MQRTSQHDLSPLSAHIPEYDRAPEYDFDQSYAGEACLPKSENGVYRDIAETASGHLSARGSTATLDPHSLLPAFGTPRARSQRLITSAESESRARPAEIPGVSVASSLQRPELSTVSSGVAQVDFLTSGLPRGALTEICGPASSGRTGLMLSIIAEATSRGELCALVDTSDCFDPHSAAAAGVDLDRLLWIRCSGEQRAARQQRGVFATPPFDHAVLSAALRGKQNAGSVMPAAKVWYGRPPARSERTSANRQSGADRQAKMKTPKSQFKPARGMSTGESNLGVHTGDQRLWASRMDQALKAGDLLLQSGGFGLVILDFGDTPADIARRIPLTSWFRFRRAVENTPAVLLSISQAPCAGTCASLVLKSAANKALQEQLERGLSPVSSPTLPGQISSAIAPPHAHVFHGLEVTIEVLRAHDDASAVKRKSPRPAHATFQSRTEWTGMRAIG